MTKFQTKIVRKVKVIDNLKGRNTLSQGSSYKGLQKKGDYKMVREKDQRHFV